MFPSMAGRQITEIYAWFDVAGPGEVTMVLNGDPDWTLENGKVLIANRLSVSSQGSDWRFALNGDKSVALRHQPRPGLQGDRRLTD